MKLKQDKGVRRVRKLSCMGKWKKKKKKLTDEMLQHVPEESEGKAMWLSEGRASLPGVRAAKGKLGKYLFRNSKEAAYLPKR